MEGTRLARTSISELKKRIILAQERKSKIIQYLQELWEKYQTRKISRDFYVETAHRHFDGKTLKEWVEYYDNYINECEILIRKYKKDLVKSVFGVFVFSLILIIFLLGVGIYTQPRFVGFLIQEPVPVSEIVTDANATITTTQQQAILGQPVKWTKTISLDKPATTKIRLPIEATNISVNKISYSEENLVEVLQNQTSPIQEEPLPSEKKQEAGFSITGAVISETAQEGFLSRFFRNLGRITGRAIYEPDEKLEIEINDTATEYEIEYETPAPSVSFEEITERGKRIQITGPETIHYENVLIFTNLDESLNIRKPSQVRIHWIEDNSFIQIQKIEDTDNNGIYDYIEWIAPILSTQTFNIIVITKAEHLDSNRDFISDIYEEVRELDDVWSKEIPDQDYVRVTFESNLRSTNDITIYPRIVSGNPKIEVYEFEGTEIIAEFTSINSNKYNKIFLTNLQGEQDTFDLRITGGSVEFDHIIDPPQFARPDVTDSSTDWFVTNQGGDTEFWQAVDEVTANGDTDFVNTSTANAEIHFNLTSVTDPGVNTSHIIRVNSTVLNGAGAGETFFFHLYQGYTLIASSAKTTQVDDVYTEHTYTLTDVEAEAITDYSDLRIQIDIDKTDADEPQKFTQVFFEVPAAAADNPPQWFDNSTNSTSAGEAVEHRVRWTDDTALDGFIFSFDNGTGTLVNDSFVVMTGTNNWSNVTKGVNATVGSTIRWRVYANDSIDQWNVTDIFIYNTTAGDTEQPKWQDVSVNDTTPIPVTTVRHNVNWTDDTDLDYATLEVNGTGASCDTLANVSNAVISGLSAWANLSWEVPGACEGQVIGWRQYANDSSNNWNATDIFAYAVQNVNPIASFGTNPVDRYNSTSKSVTFDLKVSDNLNVDGLRLYGNWSGSWAVNQTNSTPVNNTYWNVTPTGIPEGYHRWAAWGNDTLGNEDFTDTNRTFLVDITDPTVALPIYTNATTASTGESVTLNISVSDSLAGVDLCRTNVETASAGNVSNNPSSGWCNLTYSLSGASEGNQTINAYVNDTAGNMALNNSFVVQIDNAPKWSDNSTNSTNAGEAVEHRVRWTDTQGLSGYIFEFDNGTGTFANDSFVVMTGTNNWSNVTKVVNSTVGSSIRWRVYTNDSINNLNATDIFTYDTTSGNAPPTIDFVEAISSITPNESGANYTTFNFTVTDTNGFADINVSTAQANFTRTGEPYRFNTSCINLTQSGDDINFSCTVGMWYYDEPGAWTINVTIKDNNQEFAENSTTTFPYNLLTSMVMSPVIMGWPPINLPDTDTGSNTDPVTINNTGNKENLNINITAIDLQGNDTLTQHIFAENFTVENVDPGCTGTTLVNNTQVNITSVILQRGNNSLPNYNNATSGQEQIFFCLKGVPQDISSQEYSSLRTGAWTIRIFLVAIIPAGRSKKKKKKEKENKLIDILDLSEYISLVDKLKGEVFSKEEIIKTIIEKLGRKYNIDREELLRIIKAREGITIPIGIFSKKLGALESLAKYMKENLDMNYREIAKELGRDERTIWTSYKKANEKQKEPIKPKETKINIPTSVFENKKLTMLESIIIYLKQKGFKFSEMEKLLERDQRNIGTIYSRAMKKIKNK